MQEQRHGRLQHAHSREQLRPYRARRAADGHKADQRGKARQEGDQAFSNGSATSVARLGQAWPDTPDAMRRVVTAATDGAAKTSVVHAI